MSKSFFRKMANMIILILCLLSLAIIGRDFIFVIFFPESATSKILKEEIGIGEYKYLEEIYNGRWEKVCVLIPYQEWVVGLSDKKKEAFIDKKIFWSVGLVVNEVLWHLLFFRNAHDDNYFDYVSFKTSQLDIRQQNNSFSQKLIDDFKQAGFSPAYCAERDQAVMFKTEGKWGEETHIDITLGVIDK